MSRADIEQLTGNSLAVAVAERVMGWTRLHLNEIRDAWEGLDGGGAQAWMPAYSTDMAAAWPLAERFGIAVVPSEDGYYAIRPEDIEHGGVHGMALIGGISVCAESAAEAICKCALLCAEEDANE